MKLTRRGAHAMPDVAKRLRKCPRESRILINPFRTFQCCRLFAAMMIGVNKLAGILRCSAKSVELNREGTLGA